MATYAVGDVQGCYLSFQDLLEECGFDARRDRLWLVGDLVNRGPRSLEMLRWAVDHQECVTAVLGNHETRLLALEAGVVPERKAGELRGILGASDRARLLAWVRSRPLLHREDRWVLVHAGLLPAWTIAEAAERARHAEEELRGERMAALLAELYSGREPAGASNQALLTLSVLTTLRTCDAEGCLTRGHPGAPEDLPPGQHPWYALPSRREPGQTVLFGHWAALGVRCEPGIVSLDSGCVWGGRLSALRLDDGRVFQVPPRPDEIREYRATKSPR